MIWGAVVKMFPGHTQRPRRGAEGVWFVKMREGGIRANKACDAN